MGSDEADEDVADGELHDNQNSLSFRFETILMTLQ